MSTPLLKSIVIAFTLLVAFLVMSSDALADCQLYKTAGHEQQWLGGKHRDCNCEGCHVNHILKGTPTTCAVCHGIGGSATSKISAAHIPTQNATCDRCHGNAIASWRGVTPAVLHPVVVGIACATCHNNTFAKGKTSEHIPTEDSCDTCHKSRSSWDATFTHQNVVVGTCTTCHNGRSAKGKTSTHLPTQQSCDTCHKNYNSFAGALLHPNISVTTSCATCHNGVITAGKGASHPPNTSQVCETCHTQPGKTWACF
jgi:hypothetical protein